MGDDDASPTPLLVRCLRRGLPYAAGDHFFSDSATVSHPLHILSPFSSALGFENLGFVMHSWHLLVDLGILFLVDLVCSVGGSSVVELLFDSYAIAVGSHLTSINW